MKKIITTMLLLPILVFAQQEPVELQKKMLCNDAKVIIDGLIKGDYAEKPVWFGKDTSHGFALFANSKTGTWTLLEFDDNIACVIGEGTGHKIVPLGKPA